MKKINFNLLLSSLLLVITASFFFSNSSVNKVDAQIYPSEVSPNRFYQMELQLHSVQPHLPVWVAQLIV